MKCHGPGCTKDRSELSDYFCSEQCQRRWNEQNGNPLEKDAVVESFLAAIRAGLNNPVGDEYRREVFNRLLWILGEDGER